MSYNWNPYYVPGVDKEFQSKGKTYKQRYVDYNPLSRECKSRHRRFLEFINASGLIEELRGPSFKHLKFYETSSWKRSYIKLGYIKSEEYLFY